MKYLVQGNKREGLGQIRGGCTGVDCAVERCSNAGLIERTENAESQGPEFLFVGARAKGQLFHKMRVPPMRERTVIAPRPNVKSWSAPLREKFQHLANPVENRHGLQST